MSAVLAPREEVLNRGGRPELLLSGSGTQAGPALTRAPAPRTTPPDGGVDSKGSSDHQQGLPPLLMVVFHIFLMTLAALVGIGT